MSKLNINIGSKANDKSGDTLRTAFDKINLNFSELYTLTGGSSSALTELAQDYAAPMFNHASHTNITATYDDANNKILLTGVAAQIQSNWTATTGLGVILNKPALFSGSYTDLTSKPTIPTSFSSLVNGANTIDLGSTGVLTVPHSIFGNGTSLALSTGATAPGAAVAINTSEVDFNFSDARGGFKFKNLGGATGSITFPDSTVQTTAFQDVATHAIYVHPNPSNTYTATGSIMSPFTTVSAAISAAVTAGYVDSNPATIILLANITENITLKPGIYLTSLGTGTHGSPTITGTVTITSSTGIIVDNHYSISNLRIVAPSNGRCILFTGTAPQKLFVRDMWLDANGSGSGIYMDNTGTGSTIQFDVGHLAHSGSGDVYCINVTKGNCYITDIETSGAVQVAAVQTGATLTIDGSELDATGDVVCESYGTGALTITNSIINNTQTNGNGIKINGAGGVVTLGNNLITVPAGTGYAVQGVSGTFLIAANNFFTANTARSTAITYVALSSTWTTKA